MGGKRKAVAFVMEQYPCGGAERVTSDVARYLSEKGYKVYVLASDFRKEKMGERERMARAEIVEVVRRRGQKSKEYAADLAQRIKDLNLTAVVYTKMFRRLPMVARLSETPSICVNHGQVLWEIPVLMWYKERDSHKRLGWRLRWLCYDSIRYKAFGAMARKFKARYKSIIKAADRYAVLCEDYKSETARRLSLSARDSRKIVVLENSCDIPAKVNREKDKNIIFVGRLTYMDKRVDRLIEVWRRVCGRLPEWTLTIVGDGEERENLESLAAGLPRVTFAGHQTDVSPFYQRASILCLTSAIESWGLCLMEAQTYGVVPIAFDCSAGVRHLLSPDGENGVLVPEGDIDAYADKLLSLASDEGRLAAMRENVLRKSAGYGYEKMGRKWLGVIEEIGR